MGRESFIFYRSFYEAMSDINDKDKLKLYNAICKYALYGEETELTGISNTLFKLIKPQLEANNKRFEDGKKGGRPKNITTGYEDKITTGYKKEKTTGFEKVETTGYENKKPNVNVNDNDDVNENDNVNDNMQKKADKKIHFAEFVTMTNDEYKKLEIAYGKEFTDQCITVLDNYKGANGKRYKSDYRAILNWVIDKVKTNYKTKPEGNVFFNILKEEGKFNE